MINLNQYLLYIESFIEDPAGHLQLLLQGDLPQLAFVVRFVRRLTGSSVAVMVLSGTGVMHAISIVGLEWIFRFSSPFLHVMLHVAMIHLAMVHLAVLSWGSSARAFATRFRGRV